MRNRKQEQKMKALREQIRHKEESQRMFDNVCYVLLFAVIVILMLWFVAIVGG